MKSMSLLSLILSVLLIAGCTSTTLPESPKPAPKPLSGNTSFTVSSAAFEDGATIPPKFAGKIYPGGQNISVPLVWDNPPTGAQSLAIIMFDRQANNFVHWLLVDIPPTTSGLREGVSGTDKMPSGARELANDFGKPGYGGPTPPAGTGEHEYQITVYALSTPSLEIDGQVQFGRFSAAIEGKAMGSASLVGTLSR